MPKPTAIQRRYLVQARRVIAIEADALRHVSRRLDAHFAQAVGWTLEALASRNKIIVTGVGKSGHIAQKIAATLTSTGAPSVFLDPLNALHGDLGVVAEGDVVLALSYSGQTEELARILPALRRLKVRVISMTGKRDSSLARQADLHLDVRVPKEACPLNLAPTSSTTAMLAVGDALAMVLLSARGFRKEDFARFHPGGTLGHHLLTRVGEVMRPREAIALVAENATVHDALRAWTRRRTGAAVVVNARGKLAGIFTHGDFVRGYQVNPQIGAVPIKKMMTRRPITVGVDKLAVEVLNLFSRHRIDDLVVVNGSREPVGLVDAQDLSRLKLM